MTAGTSDIGAKYYSFPVILEKEHVSTKRSLDFKEMVFLNVKK